MELFEQIRRDHDREGTSIRRLAERHGVHRRTVRQALASPLPPTRKRPERRPAPALGPHREAIDDWLIADRDAPPKQRHSAHRIYRRLIDELGAQVSERQVRRYVRERRGELGVLVEEAFVPLVHEPAAEAEVDWGEAEVCLGGERRRVHLFLMRSCHSGACFVQAFARETQQAFLEGHVGALAFFGGAFASVRYDNLGSAVAKILKGRRRIETDRFVALRSHYLFASEFTRAGKQGAHEKGGVEGEVGRFRRNHLVPVPELADLAELNARLLAACELDLGRTIAGRRETVGAALARELPLLRPLPAEPFDTAETARPRVDSKALVTIRQNRYSVPVGLIGLRVSARVGAREITLHHDGQLIARHERLHERGQTAAQLDHYLELLARKPGAMARSLALRQERERGEWPACFDSLWEGIAERVGALEAACQMVEVALLCREAGLGKVEKAVRGALAAGAYDGRAVAVLARRAPRIKAQPLDGLEERLAATASPPPELTEYDRLLGAGR